MTVVLLAVVVLLAFGMAYAFTATIQLLAAYPLPLTLALTAGILYCAFKR